MIILTEHEKYNQKQTVFGRVISGLQEIQESDKSTIVECGEMKIKL
jgi:cyclophilin family peptidyl-prolyl cis-trans isomerase